MPRPLGEWHLDRHDCCAPAWVDDLFPFPTPPALAKLVDIAWPHAFIDEELYDDGLLTTHYDFMFDLESVPRAPDGWEEAYPGPAWRGDHVPLFATPEYLQFGHLGNGTYVGWVVPAPELGGTDHPVALFGQEPGGRVIARDTRAGLEWMLSFGLRKENLSDDDRSLIARVAAELDLDPASERAVTPDGFDVVVPLELAVPSGWRHEPGAYGIGPGVLAPADAFAPDGPMDSYRLDDVLADAAQLLGAGFPATALHGIMDAFHRDIAHFTSLLPLWVRAYQDLGRPQFTTRLDHILPMYEGLQPLS
ncbi:hypothetical protein [Nonomuraea sp. NPDC049129]|uniref:hypothetical protein n=1 Tax=Nonomuraea sp. NPDC049129 TaxID=3155272 RepID=UPI0033FAD0E6